MSHKQPAEDDYVDVKFVMARYAISEPTCWRWTKAKLLPAPVKLGPNTTRWRLSSLLAFEQARSQESGGQA